MKALTESIKCNKNFSIMGIDYTTLDVGNTVYIFRLKGVNSSMAQLKSPKIKDKRYAIIEVIDTNKIIKDKGYPVFEFKYCDDSGNPNKIFVYTIYGNRFSEVGNKEIIDKPKETLSEKIKEKTKGKISKIVDRIRDSKGHFLSKQKKEAMD